MHEFRAGVSISWCLRNGLSGPKVRDGLNVTPKVSLPGYPNGRYFPVRLPAARIKKASPIRESGSKNSRALASLPKAPR